jgi:hypothetical protein
MQWYGAVVVRRDEMMDWMRCDEGVRNSLVRWIDIGTDIGIDLLLLLFIVLALLQQPWQFVIGFLSSGAR